uniref:Uncharacterized protein n=1 Tax=Rhizophora mucronata TaxID=61149 RepID=A0A2P2PZP0_RHIMU
MILCIWIYKFGCHAFVPESTSIFDIVGTSVNVLLLKWEGETGHSPTMSE